jgi:hypothetical protein
MVKTSFADLIVAAAVVCHGDRCDAMRDVKIWGWNSGRGSQH